MAARAGVILAAALGCAAAVTLAPSAQHASGDPLAALPHAAGGLDVLPFPGTPDAPPGTPLSFPSLPASSIASVSVRGSHSGPDDGRLLAVSGERGSEFVPSRPFLPGERVAVTVRLRSGSAGAAGAPGARELRFSFGVARLTSSFGPAVGAAALDEGTPTAHRARAAASSAPLTQSFVSEPKLHPPVVTITGKDTDTAAGDIFLDAQNSGQGGPYMLDSQGRLLWDDPTPSGREAFDVRVQYYQGQPVLTYYQGRVYLPGVGHGIGVMLNRSYDRIHTITAGAGYQREGIDLHELTLTPAGDALVTLFAPIHANLSSVGGPRNGILLDSIIEEIRVSDNHTLWVWSAYAHIPLSDSYAPRPRPGVPWDAYHVNSVQLLPDGELIVSARHTWSVYSINMRSGRINWEVGGKHSSFRMGPGTNFEWQHHVRMHRHGLLTVFDDGDGLYRSESQSRALEIRLTPGHATLVRADKHSPPVLAGSQGSTQLLFNKDVFVGWGAAGPFSEYTPAGRQLFSGSFRGNVQSYRAYRFNNWVGDPLAPPAIATRPAGSGAVRVYASWNGATRVASWRVLAGPARTAMLPVTQAAWQGFETQIEVHTTQPYLQVQALDSSGQVLGTSGMAAASGACVGSRC